MVGVEDEEEAGLLSEEDGIHDQGHLDAALHLDIDLLFQDGQCLLLEGNKGTIRMTDLLQELTAEITGMHR